MDRRAGDQENETTPVIIQPIRPSRPWIAAGLLLLIAVVLASCNWEPMSTIRWDRSAGMNGSFELLKGGLPANWAFYAPRAMHAGSYALELDSAAPKEGAQALLFKVNAVDSSHYWWKKPGLLQTYWALPGETYRISFWIRNDGCTFRISAGSEKSRGMHMEPILESSERISEWRLVEYDYMIPEGYKTLRFELNILEPGLFWIDDIRIKGEEDPRSMKLWIWWDRF